MRNEDHTSHHSIHSKENHNSQSIPTKPNMFSDIDLTKKNTSFPSYELSVSGKREVIDKPKAKEIVTSWIKTKLSREKESQQKLIVSKVTLSGKSYTVGGADVIAEYIRDIAPTVKSADLSDIIASRPEEEGLAVLKIICDAFFHSQLEEVDL